MKDKNLNSEIETLSLRWELLNDCHTMKDKNLNSEIETYRSYISLSLNHVPTMKDKNLNSEIETPIAFQIENTASSSMKDKNLNSEIETSPWHSWQV